MQFNVLALTIAAMASIASAQTVTVYACPSSSTLGVASSTIASTGTGVATAPTSTGSPIAYTAGASANGASAFGLLAAGVIAFIL